MEIKTKILSKLDTVYIRFLLPNISEILDKRHIPLP